MKNAVMKETSKTHDDRTSPPHQTTSMTANASATISSMNTVPSRQDAYPALDEFEKNERPLNEVDCRSQNGPLLRYLWTSSSSTPTVTSTDGQDLSPTSDKRRQQQQLSGQTLYLGMEVGCDGKLYAIPGHAPQVLQVDPNTDELRLIGPCFVGKFKWLRGVVCGDIIYGIPSHAGTVLRIHVPSQAITLLPIPYDTFYASQPDIAHQQRHQEWKYHGASICPSNQCLYAIPQSALHVLKIDPSNDTVELVGPELPGRYKWYGGIVGKQDGAVYGIPHNSPHVLRIRGDNDITLHGNYGTGGHKWHGAAAAPNGTIVSVPANADTVLCIQPPQSSDDDPELFELGGSDCIKTGRHRSDNKYKYLGAMTGTNGKVYCFPSGSERVLEINAEQRTLQLVGPNLYDTKMERLCQNKWQNGLVSVRDSCVYAIPLAAESLLRIDCAHDPPHITTWPLPFPHKGLAKWEGGIVAPNGVIYTVPNNHKAILRIESPKSDHERPTSYHHPPLSETVPLSDDCESSESYLPQPQRQPQELQHRIKEQEHYDLPYSSGIPTLRSSAHRVKYSLSNRKHDPKPSKGETWLPPPLRVETVFDMNPDLYQELTQAVCDMLRRCDPSIVGSFRDGSDRLEDFCVPVQSTWRKVNGGQCETAQQYLSDAVANDTAFLNVFDRMVTHAVLPHLKARLVRLGIVSDDPGSATFYYQRPPTLRLQPGPAWAQVKPHNDAEYGHQNGELNFWIPLTDRDETRVDLWCETEHLRNDYHPVVVCPSQIASFHGSSCRHYLNTNSSNFNRVSMDFRVGVAGFFDHQWEMRGTTNDHARREVNL